MKVRFDVFRKKPGASDSYRQIFEVDIQPGQDILDAFYKIQEEHDPSFAFRYSCRGAICGSCAVRINGTAMLACKTQVLPLASEGKTIVVDPMGNMPVIKDLVTDLDDGFWPAYHSVRPYLVRTEDKHEARLTWTDKITPRNMDQLVRSEDCIKCAACFSDCPKRAKEPTGFIGPQACLQLYKFYWDPRDSDHPWRMGPDCGASATGPFACDGYGNCVRVCPKDCRPLMAINIIRRDIKPK